MRKKSYEEYLQQEMGRAKMHARWVKLGDSRRRLRKIVRNDIKGYQLSVGDKKRLYNAYVAKMKKLAPIIITKKARKESESVLLTTTI